MNIANKLLRKFTQESSLDKNIYDFNLNTINKSVVIGISSTGKTASEKTHKYPIINPVVFVGKTLYTGNVYHNWNWWFRIGKNKLWTNSIIHKCREWRK